VDAETVSQKVVEELNRTMKVRDQREEDRGMSITNMLQKGNHSIYDQGVYVQTEQCRERPDGHEAALIMCPRDKFAIAANFDFG